MSRNGWIWTIIAVVIIVGFVAYAVNMRHSQLSADSESSQTNHTNTMPQNDQNQNATNSPNTTSTSSESESTSTPSGPAATTGSTITVSYVGKLQNGQIFDQSSAHGDGTFTFTLGVGQVIEGWDKGLMGAHAGDHLTLTIPPSEAYGSVPGNPLQNDTLIFDIDVLKVENPQ